MNEKERVYLFLTAVAMTFAAMVLAWLVKEFTDIRISSGQGTIIFFTCFISIAGFCAYWLKRRQSEE